ncbi:MAG TPA: type III pantothenate kinase [Candidatus Limnocylindrales bacterium]|jgi:type III pantothenate kinase|nr:type III pantothenate kinase [Candidatus Limnocylindrales bacterium]
MLIAIDVGNTSMTVGRLEGTQVGPTRRAATNPRASADELRLLLDGLLELDGGRMADVRQIVAASVVPALSASLAELAGRLEIGLTLASATNVPLPVRVDRPSEVGSDRLVNALAAVRLHGAPAIVVDFGTATNFDVVAADGAYIGGALAPGLELGLEALATRTAKLPRIELARPARAIGRDTVAAMQSGAVIGYIGLVRELLAAIRAELAAESEARPTVILTGGLSAAAWATEIPGVDVIDPLLTLRGLAILHAETHARATS